MTNDSESDIQRGQQISPTTIGMLMAFIAVIFPIAIWFNNYGWGDLSTMVIAMVWQVNYSSWGQNFQFDPSGLLVSLPFTCLRIVFAIMMMRLYQGKTTKKRTLLIGIASELQLAGIFYGAMLFAMLFSQSVNPYNQIIMPIPILFFVGFLIIRLYPPAETTMWIEEVESRSWWDTQQDEENDESKPKDEKKDQKEIDSPW